MSDNGGRFGAGHLLLAALGGAAIGAAAALLLAPQSGRETRQMLADRFRDARDYAARVPGAIRSASHAASEALSEELGKKG